MSISQRAHERGITEILHYTTSRGVFGTLASRALKSRARLPEDAYLEHVWVPACRVRYDEEWLDWVNLSITDINSALYTVAAGKWHQGQYWWGVLSFTPSILDHDEVYFATTNNRYPAVHRGQGLDGFEALFAESVPGRYGNLSHRSEGFPDERPTDPQAEVLYPSELSTDYLQRIYVSDTLSRATIRAQCEAVRHPDVEIVVNPHVFE